MRCALITQCVQLSCLDVLAQQHQGWAQSRIGRGLQRVCNIDITVESGQALVKQTQRKVALWVTECQENTKACPQVLECLRCFWKLTRCTCVSLLTSLFVCDCCRRVLFGELNGPLNQLNAILSLLQPLDRSRAPSAIESAIGRPYLALSRIHTQAGVLNYVVLSRLGGSTAR